MKLPLRYFVLASILLAAVAIPVGWRSYQKWKSTEVERLEKEPGEVERLEKEPGEVERLEKELAELWANEPGEFLSIDSNGRAFADPAKNAPHQNWMRRIERLHDRLEKMTGTRPTPKPMPRLED